MNAILNAIDAISDERETVLRTIDGLTKKVGTLDAAIGALRVIVDDDAMPEAAPAPIVDVIGGEKIAPSKPDATAEETITPAVPSVADQPRAQALADELERDLPKLMSDYPEGPTVREICEYYGEKDFVIRDACTRLHRAEKARFATTGGFLHLTPLVSVTA